MNNISPPAACCMIPQIPISLRLVFFYLIGREYIISPAPLLTVASPELASPSYLRVLLVSVATQRTDSVVLSFLQKPYSSRSGSYTPVLEFSRCRFFWSSRASLLPAVPAVLCFRKSLGLCFSLFQKVLNNGAPARNSFFHQFIVENQVQNVRFLDPPAPISKKYQGFQ